MLGSLTFNISYLYPIVTFYLLISFGLNKYLIRNFYSNQEEHLITNPSAWLAVVIIVSLAVRLAIEA